MAKVRKLCVLLLALLLAVNLFPVTARAATTIDVSRNCSLTVDFANDGTPIPGAKFKLYRIADVTPGGKLTPSGIFSAYPLYLVDMDQAGWQALALTLEGYILRDDLVPIATGTTDNMGRLRFTGAQLPGLYMLLGESVVIDGKTYTPKPALVHLPGKTANNGEWSYAETVLPKCTVKDEDAQTVTRKVLKAWEDNNNAAGKRPASIIVDLLKDGAVYDTQVLTAADNWRYTWEGLDGKAAWTVVERSVKDYTVQVTQAGVTFLVTNTVVPDKWCEHDPPIKKTITGDTPTSDALFRFSMQAVSGPVTPLPMPPGSDGQIKYKEVWGGGEYEFGWIRFTVPGTYVYRLKEVKLSDTGYTYDGSEYTVTYVVADDAASPTGMSATRTITKSGAPVQTVEFVNNYDASGGTNPSPSTDPNPSPSTDPNPSPSTDPNPSPSPSTDPNPSPSPSPSTDPNPSPSPSTDPNPSPSPSGNPSPSPSGSPKPSTSPGPGLPKTGQLWWPVPVLALLGGGMLIVGLIRRRREDENA